MSSKSLSEVQKKYENDFSEILIQKINHVGGSLQFQHLAGLLQQLPYEIKDAFGTSKSELMKFLRGKPQTFKIDAKGVVTVVGSISLGSCSNTDTDLVIDTPSNTPTTSAPETSPPEINNGKGFVLKIYPEFAIIKAMEPIGTFVYFTPLEYGASKDTLFIDLNLTEKTEVFFNAVYGHNDYEIEYRATKVWQAPSSDDEYLDSRNFKRDKNITLSGEGFIKKLFHESGHIMSDKESKIILFDKNSVKDCDVELVRFFKIRDCVKFTAECVKRNSKFLWIATEVEKKKKRSEFLPAYSETSDKTQSKYKITKRTIENEDGKIYPYSHGAVIKFGRDCSELADGDSSDYFLYGSKVSDIPFEFSEGDTVKFDAVQTKTKPGWRAILVWVGEKPSCTNSNKNNIDDDSDEISEDHNVLSSSDVSSERSNSLAKSRIMKSKPKDFNPKLNVKNKSNTLLDHSVSRKLGKFKKEYNKNNLENVHLKNSFKSYKTNKTNNKHYKENLPMSKYKNFKDKLSAKLTLTSNSADENYNSLHSRETVSDVDVSENSKISSEEDNELQIKKHNFKKFFKEDKYKHSEDTLKVVNFPKEEIKKDKYDITSESLKSSKKIKPCIKKFEDIQGEIVCLYCKVALITNSHLQEDVNFVLNNFYLNGKSVEEEQVNDLKEVIKVGDIVNFNYFEIIDDFGDIHRKVTVAWKGPKPSVYEMEPEEFIAEEELSVSISNEIDIEPDNVPENNAYNECISVNKTPQSFLALMNTEDSDNTCDSHSENESSLNDTYDNACSMESKDEICENFKNDCLSTNVHHNLLSRRIIQSLKNNGVISSDSEIEINIVHEIINRILKESNIKQFHSSTVNQDNDKGDASEIICSSCTRRSKPCLSDALTSKHAEVQTIITGDIVATSIYTQN